MYKSLIIITQSLVIIFNSSWWRQTSIMSSINGLMCSVYVPGRDLIKVSEIGGGHTKGNTRYK